MIRDKRVTNAAWMMYDGENKLGRYSSDDAQTNPMVYLYDADGKRKAKGGYHFIHGLGGELLADYSGIEFTEYAYRNGDMLFKMDSKVSSARWLVKDHLGTPRMAVGLSGALSAVKRHDYLPFGEEIGSTVGGRTTSQGYGNPQSDGVRQQFTGYERDDESGLDFAEARYHAQSLGRFTSPDPYKIVAEFQVEADTSESRRKLWGYLGKPQRWNQYAYVVNNPHRYTDPSGEDVVLTGTAEEQQKALARYAAIMGSERMALVNQTTRNGQIVLSISNDAVAKMQKIGDNTDNKNFSLGMAEMLNSQQTVEFRVTEKFTDAKGNTRDLNSFDTPGAVTVSGELSTTGNIQIFVSSRAGAIATEAAKTLGGNQITSDGKDFVADNEMVDAHEFGHGWDRMRVNGPPSVGARPATTDNSISFENAVRSRNPQNSQRRTKH